MIEKKVSNMILLTAIIFMFSFLFASCGDDNPVKPPPDPVAEGLSSVAGDHIKAVMGATVDIEFVAVDSALVPAVNNWVHFSALVGDGSLVNDSVKTDTLGKAVGQYSFDGTLGHAQVQAFIRDADTVAVSVRADALITGATGQGQYVLLTDTYADIKDYNGTPERIDIHPDLWILIAVYENLKGLVFVLDDVNRNEVLSDTATILELIVNSVYTGKTKDSLGIGSTLSEVFAVYTDSTVAFDPTSPPAYYYEYPAQGITFWTDTATVETNRVVFEIHLTKNIVVPPVAKQQGTISGSKAVEANSGYKFIGTNYYKLDTHFEN